MNLGETFSLLTLEAAQITSSEDIFTPLTKLFLDTVQELKNLNISKNNIKPDAIEDNLDDLETNCDLERINFSNNREISADREFFCFSAHNNLLSRPKFTSNHSVSPRDSTFRNKMLRN